MEMGEIDQPIRRLSERDSYLLYTDSTFTNVVNVSMPNPNGTNGSNDTGSNFTIVGIVNYFSRTMV